MYGFEGRIQGCSAQLQRGRCDPSKMTVEWRDPQCQTLLTSPEAPERHPFPYQQTEGCHFVLLTVPSLLPIPLPIT